MEQALPINEQALGRNVAASPDKRAFISRRKPPQAALVHGAFRALLPLVHSFALYQIRKL
jgi:hypothetical protein